jgi:hypothetical protein
MIAAWRLGGAAGAIHISWRMPFWNVRPAFAGHARAFTGG